VIIEEVLITNSRLTLLPVHVMMLEPAKITAEKATPESRYSIDVA
jgi:hypothetical protein